jgi:hypothetical protein
MKKYFFFLVCLLSFVSLFAQDNGGEQKGFQKDKLFLGGNFGLSFGDFTFINVSPQLGYRFSEHFAAGAGINGQYVSLKQRYVNGDTYSKTAQGVAGLNLFGRVYPIRNIMLQLQPEANYVFGKEIVYQPSRQEYKLPSTIAPSLLAGGGLVLPAGRGAMIVSLFYDLLQNPNAPYGNRPIFGFTYNIGL